MKAALDTNVLVYAEGVNGTERRAQALELIAHLPPDRTSVPAQALGELFHVLIRKAGRSKAEARNALLAWRNAFPVIATAPGTVLVAADLAADHDLGIWDSVILAAASAAGCNLLLSEDLQDGFSWGGVTVVNPFAPNPSPLLAALVGDPR